jgi:hypothetical protein
MIELREPAKDEITRRAYALYLIRGCEEGRDVEDWFRAENKLTDETIAGTARTSGFQHAELR